MSARSDILGRIKKLESDKHNSIKEPDWHEEALISVKGDLLKAFCKELEKVDGECFLIDTLSDFSESLEKFIQKNKLKNIFVSSQKLVDKFGLPFEIVGKKPIETTDAICTLCECIVVQTGSVVMSSSMGGGRKTWAFPPIHIVVASDVQLVPTLKEATTFLTTKYGNTLPSQISVITGSSRTADIEKTLVKGAHGPVKLVVFIIKEVFN